MSIINEIILEDGQENPASIFVDENGKIKFKDRDSVSSFMSSLAAQGGVAKLIDAAHGEPSDTLPSEVVVYIDLDDMQLYKRTESGWGAGLELRGPTGSRGSKIFQGPLAPNVIAVEDSAIGDIYIETGYTKTSRRMLWTRVNDYVTGLKWQHAGLSFGHDGEDGAPGTPGERGKSVYEGTPDPNTFLPSSPNLPEGFFDAAIDDLYIETDSHQIWKKIENEWVKKGSTFRGSDGSPGARVNGLFQGTWEPNSPQMQAGLSDAIPGDIYIETDSHRLWKKISTESGGYWTQVGESFKGSRGGKVFQGSNSSGPNIWLENETMPVGFEESIDGDIYVDTKYHRIWKKVDGSWLQTGESYRSRGIISGLMNPNYFDYSTVETAFHINGNYYNSDLLEFSKDYFAVKDAKIEDSYIDSIEHIIYVKKRLVSSSPSVRDIWESKGLSFKGQDAYTSYLTDELVSVPAGSTGVVSIESLSNITGEFVVMKGSTRLFDPIVSFGYITTNTSGQDIFVDNTNSYLVNGVKIQINDQGIYTIVSNESNWYASSESSPFRLAAKIQDGIASDDSDDTIIEKVFKIVKNKTGRLLVLRSSSQIFKITSYGNIEEGQEIKITANVKGVSLPATISWKIYKIKADGVTYRLLSEDYSDQTYFSMAEIEIDTNGDPVYDGDADAVTIDAIQFSNIINSKSTDDQEVGRGVKIVASRGGEVVDEMSILSVNDGIPGRSVKLTASTYNIVYDSDGFHPSPTVDEKIKLTAKTTNYDQSKSTTYKFYSGIEPARTLIWTNTTGIIEITPPSSIPATPETYTVETYQVGSTESIASDSITIVGLRSGSSAITTVVTNASHSFPTDGNGTISAVNYASGETQVYVYEGSNLLEAVVGNTLTSNGQFRVVASPPPGLTYSSNAGTIIAGSDNKKLKFTPQSSSNLTSDVARTSFSIYVLDNEGIEREAIIQEQSFTKSKAGNDSKSLVLSADKNYFNKAANGSFSPAEQKINFTATLQNLLTLLVLTESNWHIYKVNSLGLETELTGAKSTYLTITGNTATMNQSQYAAALGTDIEVRVKVIAESITSVVTISKLTDGTQTKIYAVALGTPSNADDIEAPYDDELTISENWNNKRGGGKTLQFEDVKMNYGNIITNITTNNKTTLTINENGKYQVIFYASAYVNNYWIAGDDGAATYSSNIYISITKSSSSSTKYYNLKESYVQLTVAPRAANDRIYFDDNDDVRYESTNIVNFAIFPTPNVDKDFVKIDITLNLKTGDKLRFKARRDSNIPKITKEFIYTLAATGKTSRTWPIFYLAAAASTDADPDLDTIVSITKLE